MVHAPPTFNSSSTRSAENSASENRAAARAQKTIGNNTLSEPFRTPVLGGKDGFEDPSPTYSNSISPAFIVRNLDEDPHTGLTPVSQSFEEKKKPKGASRLSHSQLPSPPSSPPELATSRIPRRSQDDLSLKDTSRKLQEASSTGVRPRRISIPTPLDINTAKKPVPEMTASLAPPAPITIPTNDPGAYPDLKSTASAKSPGAFASFFRWNANAIPAEASPNHLLTPSSASHPVSPRTPQSPSIASLEQELRAVSSDLAYSIRREMELEDTITRLQDDVVRLGGEGKRTMKFRTSDYFSELSFQGSPPLKASDEGGRMGHSRMSSVALEDLRVANERVTQLEKEVLQLKADNLDLTTAKRETDKKLKEQKSRSSDSKKIQELEGTVMQLRQELLDKSLTVESLQQVVTQQKEDRSHADQVQKLTEQVKEAESQRDALQLALRQLRERQTLESKKAAERIRLLEADKDPRSRILPRTPERPVTGITHRTPDTVKRANTKSLEDKIVQLQSANIQLQSSISDSAAQIAALTITNTQLAAENTQAREMQKRLQTRLSQMEAATSAAAISEASATASLSHAHRLAVEMARVTDVHVKSLEKVRSTANASLPHMRNGLPLSPLLQSAYYMSLSPKRAGRMSSGDEATVKMMERRIKELEGALESSSTEMGEVVKRMQIAQIEMIELTGERDEALRRERKLHESLSKSEGDEQEEQEVVVES
jgi:hypothetical protein